MSSNDRSMKLAVAVFSGFVFQVACWDSHRKCFDVESKTVCYFIPNLSPVDWDTAWKRCRELDATLPVILNESGQKEFGDYLNERFQVLPVWTAGRYTGSEEWRWLNNQPVSQADQPKCRQQSHNYNCTHETQAVLTKQLKYEAYYPNNANNYICNFPGVNCTSESQNCISWKGGCLNWTTNNRLPLNKARNDCLKGGGDLATFSDKKDIDLLKEVTALQEYADNGRWIGLHRKWWIWNATDKSDVQDIKFNLLNSYGNFGKDCLFIDEHVTWKNDSCTEHKTVICQKVTDKTDSTTNGFVIGLVIAVLAFGIIIVIVLCILIKTRAHVAKAKPDARTSISKSDPVTPSNNTIVQYPDDTYATIDLDDDIENLNYANAPKPSTSYTNVEFCDNPSAIYSEPTDFSPSETNSSSVVAPVPKNSVGPSSDIYANVNKSGQQKKSDELTYPPTKIGPQGDIYTLPMSPISHN